MHEHFVQHTVSTIPLHQHFVFLAASLVVCRLLRLWPALLQDIFVISHSPSGMETGKSKSEERSKLLTDPVVTGIAYEINKANKQLNQHRLQVGLLYLKFAEHSLLTHPSMHMQLLSDINMIREARQGIC